MLEPCTIAGPVAQLRALLTSLAADRQRPVADAASLMPPDPAAPAGPRPAFEATPLERLRDMPPVERMRNPEPMSRLRAAPDAELAARAAPAGAFSGRGPAAGGRVDRLA